jgi:hypothetical protein
VICSLPAIESPWPPGTHFTIFKLSRGSEIGDVLTPRNVAGIVIVHTCCHQHQATALEAVVHRSAAFLDDNGTDCGLDDDAIDHDLDGYGIEDVIYGEGELRYEMLLVRNRRKVECAGAKMIILKIISMMAWVIASRRAWTMILTVIVIVPMKMASVTTYGFDDYGIDHDGVPDDVDDDGIDDGIDNDVIDGECELRWNRQKLESAGAKMIISMMVSMIESTR